MLNERSQTLLLLILMTSITLAAYGYDKIPQETVSKGVCRKDAAFTDKPLAEFQIKLLEQAFQTALTIPEYPHLKSRSKTQSDIVEVCLELDQPVRAQMLCDQIDIKNWRRGLAYAKVAEYCAEHRYTKESQACLRRVEKVVTKIEEKLRPDEVSWRRDYLNAMILKIRNALKKQSCKETSEKVEDLFDQQMRNLDESIKRGDFEGVKQALYTYAELFDLYYEDAERREITEEKIKTSWDKMPIVIRLEMLMKLAQVALDHADSTTALRLVNNAQAFLDDYKWTPEHFIPLTAKVAKLRFLAGDKEKAHEDAEAANDLYDTKNQEIMSIYRSDALLPLAEAFAAMNDTKTAFDIYKKAIDAGSDNPNARPRAEDLSAACGSMALSATEPTDKLWAQIRNIHKGLSDPW